MKSFIAVLTVVAVSLALTSVSFAAEKAKKPAAPHITGEVVKCADCCIKIKDPKTGDVKTVRNNEQTKVSTADKKVAAFSDVKAGDKVPVYYADEGGKCVTKRIVPPPAPKKKQ